MSGSEQRGRPSQNDYWEVSHAAGRLTSYACSLSARHIRDGRLRLQFNRGVAYYMQGIVRDVESGKKTAAQGLREISREKRSLSNQSQQIIGLAAGIFQVTGGLAMCAGSLGSLCAIGLFTAVHGMNNIYENGSNLVEGRTDAQGPVRELYQKIATFGGGTKADGNIAYGALDLGLSGHALFRKVPKQGAWKLWRYMDSDLVHAYRQASKGTLILDAGATQLTTQSLWEELHNKYKEDDK